ncbi:hypothetical protein [Catenulispora subtropica]|uniref:Uncharacterized protein n=1 Tax=Catenulispora subtropica TaxID=450798 RepID=A0ABP5E6Y5_9ACTN
MDRLNEPHGDGPPPTAVLRGGPLDGETHALTDHRFLLNITRGHVTYRYAPTSKLDDRYPTLVVFEFVEQV